MRLFVSVLSIIGMAGCGGGDHQGQPSPDAQPTTPTVIATTPTDHASDVDPGITVDATFSADMDATTIDTTTFVERAGKTTMTTTVLYASKEIRDAVLKSPMESGVAKSYDKLAEVLAATPVRSGK